MSMVDEQAEFLKDYRKLLQWLEDNGYIVTPGELARPVEMQQIYVRTGRSKTMQSSHLDRCAGDLNIFKIKNGMRVLCTREEIKPAGDYWESLNPKNRWGGNWRGLVDSGKSHFIDAPHFERRAA